MSWEADIVSKLKAAPGVTGIVGAGSAAQIFGGDAPQVATGPRIVYSSPAVTPDHAHDGRGAGDTRMVMVRCIAGDYKKSRQLAAAVQQALDHQATDSVSAWLLEDEADIFESSGSAGQTGVYTVEQAWIAHGQ